MDVNFSFNQLVCQRLLEDRLGPPDASKGELLRIAEAGFLSVVMPSCCTSIIVRALKGNDQRMSGVKLTDR